jgi:hypothetical protein
MNRRTFLVQGSLMSGGLVMTNLFQLMGDSESKFTSSVLSEKGLSGIFMNPPSEYRPFVRWWWNGNKIEAGELVRELRLLKDAGIGGVEINPIAFPTTGDDLGKKSLTWLSDEWMEMLQVTFLEAKRLDLTCDLIVGSGWPFGAETLDMNETAQVVILYAENVKGPLLFEMSPFTIFKSVDPGVTVPNPARIPEIISIKLAPDPMNGLEEVIDFSDRRHDEVIRIEVPAGKFSLHVLVKFRSFASVINGAPGAAGPILNHFNAGTVRKYLDHMSDTIQGKTGPLSNHIRALFTDSMELEGSNWTEDLPLEFLKRRGYDIMAWLPFLLFKVGRLGSVIDENYGAAKTPDFTEKVQRVRFDFERTKAELLRERFTNTYLEWCRQLRIRSRAQAYGRGFFLLESSLGYDIPEGESWTTNWLKHKIGEEMPDEDYRRGRAYTWINKFVSSAAHLEGKRIVSCEEMTNTYNVFNETLELLKIGSDQSILSGITHSVWHGFNYSPPEAPFPGWVQYGSWYNEGNNLWPWFRLLNDYKARISGLLQNSEMYSDIAILPAINDLWSEMGVQTDPFPEKLNVPYTPLIWEAIHKTGGGADFTSETILQNSMVKNGKLCYGKKEYGTLLLVEVTSLFPETLAVLYNFVSSGGRIFCIGKYPHKSLGFNNFLENDRQVEIWVEKLKMIPDQFILLKKPENRGYLEWYQDIMMKYHIPHYLTFENPNPFVMQNRYCSDDGSEIFFIANAHRFEARNIKVTFSPSIAKGKYPWIWDPETGEQFLIDVNGNSLHLEQGPGESRLIVFNRKKQGPRWKPVSVTGPFEFTPEGPWQAEFRHSRENWVKTVEMEKLKDLKDTEFVNFTGTVVYRISFFPGTREIAFLNLGRVFGISEVLINSVLCGVKWVGRRIFPVASAIKKGENVLEIRVITTMGNYMKTLTDNPTAQKFTVLKTKDQPIQSMGLIGPVTMYGKQK